jgi:hypothetical protein
LDNNKLIGIILLAVGVLLLLGWLDIPFLTEIVAIAMIVIGILILVGKFSGPAWLGVLLIVLGILVFLKGLPFLDAIGRTVAGLIDTIVAVILIVLGILKLVGK